MSLGELGDSSLDGGHSLSGSSHLCGREVRVTSGTVPVTGEGFWVERGLWGQYGIMCGTGWTYLDSPLFTDSEKQESSHPEVVSHIDTGTWTDLELPLRRHDLGVDTRDLDTGIQAGSLLD